jgi:hypothetical protein
MKAFVVERKKESFFKIILVCLENFILLSSGGVGFLNHTEVVILAHGGCHNQPQSNLIRIYGRSSFM